MDDPARPTKKGTKKSEATRAKMSATKKAAFAEANQIITTMTEQARYRDVETGRYKAKLSDADVEEALDMIASGCGMTHVADHFKIDRRALWQRAYKDADFKAQLEEAIEIGAWMKVEQAEDAAWGGKSSTGSIERDKLAIQMTQWKASRLNRKRFGDKLEVDQRSISITIDPRDAEW